MKLSLMSDKNAFENYSCLNLCQPVSSKPKKWKKYKAYCTIITAIIDSARAVGTSK